MREYEMTIIGKPDLDSVNLAAMVEKVKGFVTADGGVVSKTDVWGMRHLTYPIRKYRDGHYVHMLVRMNGAAVARLEQRVKLNEDVIRYLIVATDEESTAPDMTGEAPVATPEDGPAA